MKQQQQKVNIELVTSDNPYAQFQIVQLEGEIQLTIFRHSLHKDFPS